MLKVPGGGGVRPTQDRVRQALFSSLGGAVEGARVLDLFAGTGALGLEAMSRGAASARWVEQNGKVFAILRENVRSICGEDGAKAGCTKEDVPAFLRRGRGESFDLILADPPYEWVERGGAAEGLMEAIREGGWLVEGGVFVLEMG
ncbi:MAG TPA: RsmD family RNA methyltransferase, partial [Kiritimatiellia bacterium]|nr:RsmD family RNA methyltransferase [Kiritimatiellia bacterium]